MMMKENGLQELVPRYGRIVECAAEIIWRKQAIPLEIRMDAYRLPPRGRISHAWKELVGQVGAVQRSLLFMDVGLEQGSRQL